ncbi:MAG: ABC transporter permease [Desulfovibrionaceae bacterium]|nr:ABC transporter permease [Desulfovibrionaceae bacterium]
MALMLFEIRTLYGEAKLGYLWALIKTASGVLAILMLRICIHARASHGISIISFLVMGFIIWQIFSQTVTKTMTVIKSNRTFLTFPQVYPLDIILARLCVIISTEVVCGVLLLTIFEFLGFRDTLYCSDLYLLFFAIFGSALFGVSVGCIVQAVSRYIPALVRIIPLLLRILFFASGVFFSVSSFSHKFGQWLLYNPVMQFIEMGRTAVSHSYPEYFDMQYLLMLLLPLITISLLLERYARKYELR